MMQLAEDNLPMPRKKLIEAKQYIVMTDWMEIKQMKGLVIEYPSNYPGLRQCKTIIVLYGPFEKCPSAEFDFHMTKELLGEKFQWLLSKVNSVAVDPTSPTHEMNP